MYVCSSLAAEFNGQTCIYYMPCELELSKWSLTTIAKSTNYRIYRIASSLNLYTCDQVYSDYVVFSSYYDVVGSCQG